jgi:hypothetical protein
MESDYPEMNDLEDAIIEDTVHCDLCGASWVLGGNDGGVIIEHKGSDNSLGPLGRQIKLCVECSGRVHDAYRENLREAGICEHGINDGEYCEGCNREYKRARRKDDPSDG